MHRKQETWFLAHVTNHPLLHTIIIHIIHIIIIFLFQLASENLIVYFPIKPIGVYFYITGQPLHVLKDSFYNPFAIVSLF